MKTILLDNIFSEKELFHIYAKIISSPNWRMNAQSDNYVDYGSRLPVFGPVLQIKESNLPPQNYAFNLWGESVVFRIAKLLKEKNVGIPTQLDRMWFNCTHNGKKTQHWLHTDTDDSNTEFKSIVIFITPIWQPDWRGSFYIDGEEFKFKPGSAVIFDSNEYHQGEAPISETYNWQRITCNILVKK